MELRQLNTLVNILDFGGFAAAGESIGLTQSAVSLQIKALEEELGEDLFDRSKRPPMPNAKAISMARKAREILHMCSDLSDFSTEQLSGSLQLGAVPTVQRTMLPQALKRIRDIHPDLFISVTTGLSDELCRSVYRGVLDAAIVSEPTKLATGMSWHPFSSETLVVIASETSRSNENNDVPDLLRSSPYIRFKKSTWAGELIDTELKNLGIKVKTVVETDNLDSIWEMVACGLGVAVVPQYLIEKNKAKGMVIKRMENNTDINNDKNFTTIQGFEGVKVLPLSENPIELVTGLVERTADPKAHLISGLYDALRV